MGYRGHDSWRDMSDYVVHFTKPPHGAGHVPDPSPPAHPGRLTRPESRDRMRYWAAPDVTGYYQMMSILYDRELRPGQHPFGAARELTALGDSQRAVCFSEIPLDMLDRLVERRSRYGIGFRKDVLITRGGAPLWYLDKASPQARTVSTIIQSKIDRGIDPADPIWKLTPFIDQPGDYGGHPYRFEWEREWRVAGPFGFEPADAAFLFLPEDDHDAARQFFADVKVEHSGPVYECPYIDPTWSIEKIEEALESVPPLPDPRPTAVPWWADSTDW